MKVAGCLAEAALDQERAWVAFGTHSIFRLPRWFITELESGLGNKSRLPSIEESTGAIVERISAS
jgi:hypothetical protein